MTGFASRMLLSVCLVLAAGLAQSQADDLEEQVRRMIRSARQMDYQGILVHGIPVGVESMRLYHRGNSDGTYRERLVMLTGPARELVRNGHTVHRYHPELGKVVSGPRRSGTGVFKLVEEDLDRVREHYRLVDGPGGRVAGREARAIELRATDGDRFTYRVWRDRATDLPLQTEVLNEGGTVVETFMFATVEPGRRPASEDLELQAPPDLPRIHRESLRSPERPAVLQNLKLPPGFRLDSRFEGPGENGGEHLFYTDGLATLSIFLEEVGEDLEPATGSREILQRGALHACSVHSKGYRITLLGELPGPAMRRIMDSLEPASGGMEE